MTFTREQVAVRLGFQMVPRMTSAAMVSAVLAMLAEERDAALVEAEAAVERGRSHTMIFDSPCDCSGCRIRALRSQP